MKMELIDAGQDKIFHQHPVQTLFWKEAIQTRLLSLLGVSGEKKNKEKKKKERKNQVCGLLKFQTNL